ncbi:SDR family oxidoreductase [Microvirga sp. 3-52]|nr:SDR family oxidoreductase [Microvirga sp. 3-52]
MTEMKIVLITGASSGIGEAVALELSKAGHAVIVGARRTDRLQDLTGRIEASGGVARAHRLDVTSRDDFTNVVKATLEEFGRIDVIVNNAGVMPLSPLNALKVNEWDQMVDVNIKGVLNGIAAVLPTMEARGCGHIINVASIGAHRVSPTAAVYCATKYAVWALSDGLRQETDRLRVTVISPGVVTSELAETISDEAARAAMREFRRNAIDPDAIGRAIRYAIEQPPEVDVSEIIVRPTASPH